MGVWSRLMRTLRADRRARHEDEISEEIEFHLAMKARDAGGGAREARLRFGPRDAIREETRAAGVVQWLESFLQDTRYGLRQLRRAPALTLAVVLSLTIGIGANSAIFHLVDTKLVKGLPVPDAGSLVVVHWVSKSWPGALASGHSGTTDDDTPGQIIASSFGPKLYRRLAREQSAVAAVVGFTDGEGAGIVPRGGIARQARLQYVSDNFFQGLEVAPVLGRAFVADDDRPGIEPAVILSHRLWQQQFGARADVIDEPLRINGTLTRVIGVAPAGFFGNQIGSWTDVYAPLSARGTIGAGFGTRNQQETIAADRYWWVRMMARLKPGADAGVAREQLAQLYRQIVVPEGVSIDAAAVPDLLFRPGARGFDATEGPQARALMILMLLVTLILLIVCANVANLLLSRAVARQREAAVRLSLGAGRWRLLRQQLVESAILAGLGGAMGLAIGVALPRALTQLMRTTADMNGMDYQLNARLIAYTAGVSMLTALIFGCAPACRMARADFNAALKMNSRSVLAGGRLRLPRVLVVVQIALCLTVLVAAGLLGRTLANLKGIDIGFERHHIVYVSASPFHAGYQEAQVRPYADRLRDALAAVPGVTRAGFIMQPPLQGGTSTRSAHALGGTAPGGAPSTGVQVHHAGDGLIEALGLRLIAGRTIEPRDLRGGPAVIVVDEPFARKLFPGENPIGRRVSFNEKDTDVREIVGVVSASRYDSLRRVPMPMIYQPWQPGQSLGSDVILALRTSVDPRAVFDSLRSAAASVDPNVPLDRIVTQDGFIDGLLRTERLLSALSNGFGAVALLLAGVGLAGLLVYSVSRRTNEIGIRIALGAAPTEVARMVLRDSLWLVIAGILLGLPCAYGIAQLLRSILFDLKPADPASGAGALVLLITVAALAAWLPARRAARIDPIAALRED
jgi:macrolide transport system ATP-binding/permease protein